MPHIRKLPNVDEYGWDPSRSLQILPVTERTSFYLMAGGDLDVDTDNHDVAIVLDSNVKISNAESQSKDLTPWEKTVSMRKIIVRGVKVGSADLVAKLPGTNTDFIKKPVKIEVVQNAEYRQAKDPANFSGSLKKELENLTLRDAILRVAEDQMNSKLGKASDGGKGKYGISESLDWCGAFAWWCWSTACIMKGKTNPFGNNIDILLSPQKAIHWVMENSDKAELVRYSGIDPMTGKGKYEYKDFADGKKVEKADVMLLRDDKNWRHVSLVYDPPVGAGPFVSLDANQGYPSIKKVERDASDKLANQTYKHVFVHLKM